MSGGGSGFLKTDAVAAALAREIEELHAFFERWLGGTCADTDAEYARFSRVLAPTFRIVTPGAVVVRRDDLLAHVRRQHGSRPGVRIRVTTPELVLAGGGFALASYEEWQCEEGADDRGRISTALFRQRTGLEHPGLEHFDLGRPDLEGADLERSHLPNGVEWLHVHETWLPRDPKAS